MHPIRHSDPFNLHSTNTGHSQRKPFAQNQNHRRKTTPQLVKTTSTILSYVSIILIILRKVLILWAATQRPREPSYLSEYRSIDRFDPSIQDHLAAGRDVQTFIEADTKTGAAHGQSDLCPSSRESGICRASKFKKNKSDDVIHSLVFVISVPQLVF